MQDRGTSLDRNLARISKTAKFAAIAVGLGITAMIANEGCNARAAAETSSTGNLHGFGYDVDASALGPNIVRITGRRTFIPAYTREASTLRGEERASRECGDYQRFEDATEKASASFKDIIDALAVYGSVPDRIACLGK